MITCQLHKLYKNHVIIGHAVFDEVTFKLLQLLLANYTMQQSPSFLEGAIWNKSLGCLLFDPRKHGQRCD